MASRLMLVEGEVQRSAEGVVHLMATRIIDRTDELDKLSEDKRMTVSLSPADIFKHPLYPRGQGHPRHDRIVPKSRNFHSPGYLPEARTPFCEMLRKGMDQLG